MVVGGVAIRISSEPRFNVLQKDKMTDHIWDYLEYLEYHIRGLIIMFLSTYFTV